MKKEIILKFKDNGIVYIVYKENDKYIAGKLINNKIDTNLVDKEKEIVNYVFDKMTIGRSIYLGNIYFENNTYKQYYDKKNRWYSFYTLDNKNIDKDVLIKLNNLYNYQDNIVYKKMNKSDSKYIKRIVKYGKKVVFVLISSAVIIQSGCTISNTNVEVKNTSNSLDNIEEIVQVIDNDVENSLTSNNASSITLDYDIDIDLGKYLDNTNQNIKEIEIKDIDTPLVVPQTIDIEEENNIDIQENIDEDIEIDTSDLEDSVIIDISNEETETLTQEFKISSLKEAINNNPNLTGSEKQFITNNFDIINSNIDYIDYNEALYTYNNLKIVYQQEIDSSGLGQFNFYSSTIKLGGCTGFNDCYKLVLLHELSHTLESSDRDYNVPYFYEALNSIYNAEYFGNKYYPEDYTKFDPAYDNIKKYIYSLAEILGPETLREYHFNQSTDYLVNKMMEYVPDEGGCYKLISDISYLGNFDEDIRETEETRYEVENILSQLYLNIYNEDMSTNLEIMAHLHPEEVAQYLDYNDEYEVISKSIEVNTQKAYFNTDAITYLQDSTYNYVRNVYTADNNMQVATLTDAVDIDSSILTNNSVRLR